MRDSWISDVFMLELDGVGEAFATRGFDGGCMGTVDISLSKTCFLGMIPARFSLSMSAV